MPVKSKDEFTLLIGQRLRDGRVAKNMTLTELGYQSGLGYSQVSRMERGKVNSGLYHVYVVAKVLDLSLESLFEGIS